MNFFVAAGAEDNVEIMEYYISYCKTVQLHGALYNLKWLLQNGLLVKNGLKGMNVRLVRLIHTSIETIEWLLGQGVTINESKLFTLQHPRSLEILEWLLKNGCPIVDSFHFKD